MTTIADRTTAEIPLACSLTDAERADRGRAFGALFAGAVDAHEIEDGYAVRLAGTPDQITQVVALIGAERSCCPFFGFALHFEPNGGSVTLEVTGPAEAKPIIGDLIAGVADQSSACGCSTCR